MLQTQQVNRRDELLSICCQQVSCTSKLRRTWAWARSLLNKACLTSRRQTLPSPLAPSHLVNHDGLLSLLDDMFAETSYREEIDNDGFSEEASSEGTAEAAEEVGSLTDDSEGECGVAASEEPSPPVPAAPWWHSQIREIAPKSNLPPRPARCWAFAHGEHKLVEGNLPKPHELCVLGVRAGARS